MCGLGLFFSHSCPMGSSANHFVPRRFTLHSRSSPRGYGLGVTCCCSRSLSGAHRARNPERPRSVKKGSAIASVGLRYADREQGDRSLRSLKRAFAARNGGLDYLRTKSSTNRKLDQLPPLGRFRKFPLVMFRRLPPRRQRTAGRERGVESQHQDECGVTREMNILEVLGGSILIRCAFGTLEFESTSLRQPVTLPEISDPKRAHSRVHGRFMLVNGNRRRSLIAQNTKDRRLISSSQ